MTPPDDAARRPRRPARRAPRPLLVAAACAWLAALAPLHAEDEGADEGGLLPVNDTPWSYVAAPFEGHCLQTYRLYLPAGDAPPDGWPVVVAYVYSGFAASEDLTSLARGSILAELVDAGLAVMATRATVSQPLDDPYWEEQCGAAPDFAGHGLFKAPGVVPTDLVADGTAPYDEPAWHMAEKDAVMAVQHARWLGRQQAPFTLPDFPVEQQAAMAALDPTRVAVWGRSAGAMIAAWTSLGPERAEQAPFAGLEGQHAEPGRPDAAALGVPGLWWPIYSDELFFPQPHFGLAGHSVDIGTHVGDTLIDDRVDNSALAYEDAARVAQFPLYLVFGDKSNVTDVTPSSQCGLPYCYKGQGTEGVGEEFDFKHAAWSGYAWKYLHPGRTRLVITNPGAWDQRPGMVQATPFLGEGAADARIDDTVGWLAQALADPQAWDAGIDAVFVPGDRLEGALPAAGLGQPPVARFRFDGVAGARLRVKAKGAGGLQPTLRLLGPDDALVFEVAAKGGLAKLKLDLPASGAYVLELRDAGGAGGDYALRTHTRRKVVVEQQLLVAHPGGAPGVTIPAVPGTQVRRVRVLRNDPPDLGPLADDEPQSTQLSASRVDLGGPFAVRLGGLVSSKQGGQQLVVDAFELPFTGDWTLHLDTEDDLPAWVRCKTWLQLPRGRRTLELGSP